MALAAMNQVLVVAAYPDDKVLGCNGTIARRFDFGDQVQVLRVTEGPTSREPERDSAKDESELLFLILGCGAQVGIKAVDASSLLLQLL